jgi:hypothetical protein
MCGMEKNAIELLREKTKEEMQSLVRERAKKSGSNIYYAEGGNIVEEDPSSGKKRIVEKPNFNSTS